MNEVKFTEVEINKLNLQPGEVLLLKFYGDDIGPESLDALRPMLKKAFPNNESLAFIMSSGKVEIEVIKGVSLTPRQKIEASVAEMMEGQNDTVVSPAQDLCGPEPTNYCNSCGCGKKERYEAANGKK